jgi:hypothetical protein
MYLKKFLYICSYIKDKLLKSRLLKNLLSGNHAITVILAVFISIRMFFLFTRNHFTLWDESVYIGMGKYLYSSGSIGLWESIRPISLPLINGAFWRVGLNPIFFGELTSIIFSAGVLFMTYLIGRDIFNKNTGILAALFLMTSTTFFWHSGLIMTEIPSVFFILLALKFYYNKRYFLSGISLGFSMMFKFTGGLAFAAFGTALILVSAFLSSSLRISFNLKDIMKNFSSNPKILYGPIRYFTGFLIVILTFALFNYNMYKDYVSNTINSMFLPFLTGSMHQNNVFESLSTDTFAGKINNIFYYIITIFNNNIFLLLFIPGIILLITLIWKISTRKINKNSGNSVSRNSISKDNLYSKSDSKHSYNFIHSYKLISGMMAIIFTVIFYMIYLTYIPNKQDRFLLVILPFIALLSAYTIIMMHKKISVLNIPRIRVIASVIIILSVTITLGTGLKDGIESYKWHAPKDNPPKIINEYYLYLNNNDIRGTILTTDPVFTSYSDNLLIPYYDTVSDKKYVNPWDSNKPIIGVIYTNYSLACMPEDYKCLEERNTILREISSKYTLIKNYSTDYAERYIFLNKS